MKIEFGVAVMYHFSGANPDHLTPERFATYDEADEFAEYYRDECEPTIYVILGGQYVFNCKRSAVENAPYKIYHIESFKEGQTETSVWWEEFTANPQNFLHLAQAKI